MATETRDSHDAYAPPRPASAGWYGPPAGTPAKAQKPVDIESTLLLRKDKAQKADSEPKRAKFLFF